MYAALRPLLFGLDPEHAHRLALAALKTGLTRPAPPSDPRLRVTHLGLEFANPVGLAAGFDKDAEVPDAALRLGFGFAETGSLTPKPQTGNERPRVFRLVEDRALINRLGFNNAGFSAAAARLSARRPGGPVGVNIGANRDSANRIDDYVAGVRLFAPLADYITINISSPNTPGLRDLQTKDHLAVLLGAVAAARTAGAHRTPILVKIAPDMASPRDLDDMVETAIRHGMDGMIVSNTTLRRDGLSDATASETGGLSGRPLFRRSTALLARVRHIADGALVLVGVGGVDSSEAAWRKMCAGADLVQLYTGLVFEGPGLPARITAGLARRLEAEGIDTIADIVGTETSDWLERGD